MKSLMKKILPVFILLFVVMACTKLGRQDPGKYEEQLRVVEVLNKKFDLHDPLLKGLTGRDFDCKYRFRVGVVNDKIAMVVTFCESTSENAKNKEKLAGVLTPENFALMKNAGFEVIVLYDRHEREVVDAQEFP